jgi:hypothetical protein
MCPSWCILETVLGQMALTKWLGAVYFGIELIAPKLYVLRDLCINMNNHQNAIFSPT